MTEKPGTNAGEFSGRVAVVTGGAGVLCAAICESLACAGAQVAVLDINQVAAEQLAEKIKAQGGKACGVRTDVLDVTSVRESVEAVVHEFGQVDFLINGAGGNHPRATTSQELPFFELPADAFRWVFDLNLLGTIIPSQIAGKYMADRKEGVILNISSMNSLRPLSRIPAYSAAKAGVSNFTQWLAVHMALEYSPNIRVNAIAPGFFLTDQNRYLLIDEPSRDFTPRGKRIIEHTPLGRLGVPQDLWSSIRFLLSPESSFVTGIMVPVDGGFSAYSGV